MANYEFLDEGVKDLVLNKIIGSTEWHGETYADEKSLENMEKANELALSLIEMLYRNADLAPNAVATFSGKALNERAVAMLRYIKEICEEVL